MNRRSIPRQLSVLAPLSVRQTLAVPLLAVALLSLSCSSGDEKRGGHRRHGPSGGSRGEAAIPVQLATVERADIARVLHATTRLHPISELPIVSRLSARLVELKVDVGDEVEKGQLLARVDDSEARHLFTEAEADSRNKSSAAARAKRSFESGLLAREDYEQARSQSETSHARTEQARLRLAWAAVRAPMAGVVLQRSAEVGELLSPGQELLTLGNVQDLRADVNLPERDLGLVAVGQRVEISVDPFPGHGFDARVERIAPFVSTASGTFAVRIELPAQTGDGPRLLPGLFARARLLVDLREQALVVPQAALLLDRESDALFVAVDGQAELVEIETGYVDDGKVEVRRGLRAGDRIVVLGQASLTPGAALRVVGETSAAKAAPSATPAGQPPGGRPGATKDGGDVGARIEHMKQYPGFRKRWDAAVAADPSLATDGDKQRSFLREAKSRRGGRR